jgi:chromosome segregation ATPase
VCGDSTDAQVIATDENLAPLTDLLKRYTVSKTPLDDLRKVVQGRKTEINKNIDQLPIRIDEVRRGLPDISGLDRKALENSIKTLEVSLSDAKLRLSGIDNGGNIADLSKKLAVINNDIQQLEQSYRTDANKVINRLNGEIEDIEDDIKKKEKDKSNILGDIKWKKEKVTTVESLLSKLRENWKEVDAETFQDTTEDTCPACGQSLPVDRVEEARDKALATFNRSKAERLSEIEIRGKGLANEKEQLTKDIGTLHASIPEIINRDDEIQALVMQRDSVKKMLEGLENIPGRSELISKKEEIEIGINAAKEAIEPQKEAINEEIDKLEELLKTDKSEFDKFQKRAEGEERVAELKAEEKKLAKEYEDLEKQLFLVESFIKRKVSLLNERINARFKLVRFKLFNQNINGGVEPCCEITVNGVPYGGGLNSAARTQAGCEIVSVLQEHYGIAPVIWIDNRESCTEIPDMRCQVVSLYVSPEDKVLRIETVRKKRIAA